MSSEGKVVTFDIGPVSSSRAWLAFAGFSARQAIRTKRTILVLMLLAVPAALVVIIRSTADVTGGDVGHLYRHITVFAMLTAIVPLVVMIFSATLIRSPAAEGTLAYLFTRKLRRENVLLARFTGVTGVLVVLACLSQAALFAAAVIGPESAANSDPEPKLLGALAVTALGVVVFSAIFSALGALLRRQLVAEIVYLVACEWVFANIPLNIRQFSVNYYLRCIVLRVFGSDEMLRKVVGADAHTASAGLLALALVTAAALAVSAVAVARKEFTRAQEEQK